MLNVWQSKILLPYLCIETFNNGFYVLMLTNKFHCPLRSDASNGIAVVTAEQYAQVDKLTQYYTIFIDHDGRNTMYVTLSLNYIITEKKKFLMLKINKQNNSSCLTGFDIIMPEQYYNWTEKKYFMIFLKTVFCSSLLQYNEVKINRQLGYSAG